MASRSKLVAPTRKPVVLRAVRPNAGIEAQYRDRLDKMIKRMSDNVSVELLRVYRRKPPEMAQDASPARTLAEAMAALSARWNVAFEEFAEREGPRFSAEAGAYAQQSFKSALRRAGFSVRFQPTRAANDVFRATVAEQVGLIKSISSEYLSEVQGMVMRSVATGRDIGGLREELEKRYGITRRRATTIARDQNNKATAVITRVRQEQLGCFTAKWLHSAGGKKPRPEHVAFSHGRHSGENKGPYYDVRKGAYLEGKWTWPGHEINCRCVSVTVIPGLKS